MPARGAGKAFEANEGSMAKPAAADAAVLVTQQTMQILGLVVASAATNTRIR